MKKKGVIRAEDLHPKKPYTLYERMESVGMPVHTIVRGHVQVRDGELVGKPIGQYVRGADPE